jgi:hypothetical protein
MKGWVLMAAVLLAGCAAQPMSVTQRDTMQACRDHADAVYDRLNRGDIYSIPQNGLPYSDNGLVGDPNAGLRQQYENDEMIDRCMRDTGAGTLTVGPSGNTTPKIVGK